MNVSTELDRAWVRVDLANLVANARQVQRQAPNAQLLPMVKADAYGLGVAHVCRALDELKPWGYGVATPAEGVELRKLEAQRPIVVFTPACNADLAICHAHDLTPVLDDPGLLNEWTAPYHLEIDTGMARGGVRWDDLYTLKVFQSHRNLPAGVFTHFHSADANAESVTVQCDRFVSIVDGFPQRPDLVHAANSAATFRLKSHWNLVRPGIFLYGGRIGGDLPDPAPVASVHARVVSVRSAKVGDTVGYGSTWKADRTTTIGTIAIGYADGVRRVVEGKAQVLVGAQRFPVVGRITMDMLMANFGPPGSFALRRGDIVTILGGSGQATITLDEFAAWAGTVSYEILVGLGGRLPRLYT